jgi:hypothetical protein
MSDALILRRRMADRDDAIVSPPSPGPSSPSLVATTTHVTTYPTSAAAYYAVQVTAPGGNEVEGGAITLAAASGGKFFALNLGSSIPPEGTAVVIVQTNGRWTFRYG